MFDKQEHKVFRRIDRCSRYGAGIEMPDQTIDSILDAHHLCRMQLLYSDADGVNSIGSTYHLCSPCEECTPLPLCRPCHRVRM
eukprot:4613727-Pyramimonas_sp.AAC.1